MLSKKVLRFEDFLLNENLIWSKGGKKNTPEDEYKIGDKVIYLRDGKTMDDWEKLSDEDRKKLDKRPASKIVGVKEILKIEKDTFYFKDKDDKEFTKDKKDIIQKGS